MRDDGKLDFTPAGSDAWSRWARWRLAAAGVLAVCLILVAAGWAGGRGMAVVEHLTRAKVLLEQLRGELVAGHTPAARNTLTALRRETAAALDRVQDPGWRLGSRLAWIGDDVSAVAAVASVLDELAVRGVPPLLNAANQVSAGVLTSGVGRINLDALVLARSELAAADAAFRSALRRVESVPVAGTHPRIKAGMSQLRGELGRAVTMTGAAARTVALVPALLGANGQRTYLVLFQNLAEPRATGGLSGAYIVVSTHRGVVRILEQGTAAKDLKSFDHPVLPLTRSQRALYTDRLGRYPGDVNFTPHFPTGAKLIREMYRLRSGRTVDGVLATDPVALSYLLRATGPVRTAGGASLTAGNVVRALLADAYARATSNTEQDRYFAQVTRAVFDRVTRVPGDPRAMLSQLIRAAGERRILVWSAHAAEQRLIAGTVVEGAMPARDANRPNIGIFLNDGGGSKLGYYLTRGVEVRPGACRADGRREWSVRVTLGSTAPRSGLPSSVLGLALAGDPYTIRTNVLVFGPTGGTVRDPMLDGVPTGLLLGTERDRAVGVATVDVRPGARRTLDMTVLTSAAAPVRSFAPQLWLTPGTTPWVRNVHSPAPC